jgi:hypothetical protein
MSRISAYQFSVAPDSLQTAMQGDIPESLVGPLQALIAAASRRAAETPFSIYVCAGDDEARARDHLAFVLAKTLTAHVPSALLVDCDFVRTGLHGVVPQKDALGLLDLLLYGSSIGVITQEAPGGVHVVGAGSFPVTAHASWRAPSRMRGVRRARAASCSWARLRRGG